MSFYLLARVLCLYTCSCYGLHYDTGGVMSAETTMQEAPFAYPNAVSPTPATTPVTKALAPRKARKGPVMLLAPS